MAQREVAGGDHAPRRLQHGGRSVMWNHPIAWWFACATWQRRGGDARNVVLEGRSCITVGISAQCLLCSIERSVAEEDVVAHRWHMTSETGRHIAFDVHLLVARHIVVGCAVHVLHEISVGLVPFAFLFPGIIRHQPEGRHGVIQVLALRAAVL